MDNQAAASTRTKKKLSKKGIIWGIIGLLALVVVALVLVLTGPSKQKYQEVLDAQTSLRSSYEQYIKASGTPRDMLALSSYSEDLEAIVSGDGLQDKLALMVDEGQLEEIERQEREAATLVVSNERYMDGLVDELGDSEVARGYGQYIEERQAIYGEGHDFEDLAESVIALYRYLYSCQPLIDHQVYMTQDEAEALLSYSNECLVAADELAAGGVLMPGHQQVLQKIRQAVQERADLLTPVSESLSQSSAYRQLSESQSDEVPNLVADRDEIIPAMKIFRSLEGNLGGMVMDKRNRAFGSTEGV